MKYQIFPITSALVLAAAFPAFATVLTFDSIPIDSDPVLVPAPYYTEAGYEFFGRNALRYGGDMNLGMTYVSDNPYHRTVDIERTDGGLFSVAGFDISPNTNYMDEAGFVLTPGDNAVIEGYLGGTLVASVTFSILEGDTSLSLTGFGEFDRIRFDENAAFAGNLDFSVLGVLGGGGFDNFGFAIDNLDLRAAGSPVAPVPVPPAVAGMALGLVLLGGIARRRR